MNGRKVTMVLVWLMCACAGATLIGTLLNQSTVREWYWKRQLRKEDYETTMNAINGLGQLNTNSAICLLVHIANSDTDPRVSGRAIGEALRRGPSRVIEALEAEYKALNTSQLSEAEYIRQNAQVLVDISTFAGVGTDPVDAKSPVTLQELREMLEHFKRDVLPKVH